MKKLTQEMKKAGEMAMRNLSKNLRGIIEKDGLSLEEVEKLLETLSDDE